jgi:hypothetical protein
LDASRAQEVVLKQRRMDEREIQSFEAGDETQVLAYFAGMSGAQAGQKFIELLRSYRDAARVANAAWLVLDDSKKNGSPSPENFKRLTDALQLYAPMNFPPPQYVHDFAMQTLAGVCDTMSKFGTLQEAAAWVADYTNRLRNARWFQGGEAT